MAGFIYFADGIVNPLTEQVIASLDLRYAFGDSVPMHGRLDSRTPAGPGTILADEKRLSPLQMAYRPDEQVWRKRAGDECVWVGYYKSGPADAGRPAARRRACRQGSRVGRRSAVDDPAALAARGGGWFHGRPAVPGRSRRKGPMGQWQSPGRVRRLRHVRRAVVRRHDPREFGQAPRLTTSEMLDIACELLAVNYAVSKLEVGDARPVADRRHPERRGVCRGRLGPVRRVVAKKNGGERPDGFRWLTYVAWKRGMLPRHRPTFAEAAALAEGL